MRHFAKISQFCFNPVFSGIEACFQKSGSARKPESHFRLIKMTLLTKSIVGKFFDRQSVYYSDCQGQVDFLHEINPIFGQIPPNKLSIQGSGMILSAGLDTVLAHSFYLRYQNFSVSF